MKFVVLFIILCFNLFAQTNTGEKPRNNTPNNDRLKDVATEVNTNETSVKVDPVIRLTQFAANDNNFRGISAYGEPLNRRNNSSYSSYHDAYLLTTILGFNTGDSKFTSNLIFFNPLVGRTDKDSDHYIQDKPGGEDKTNLVISELRTGTFTQDPNQTRLRKERNALGDGGVGEFYYNWSNRAGSFSTGLLVFANFGDSNRFATSDFAFIWRIPFFKYINPTFSNYYKFSSEFAGYGNGSIYSGLSFSHEFKITDKFSITPANHVGYQYVNDVTLRRRGIADINTSVQFGFDGFFLKAIDVYRPDTYMWETPAFNPQAGVVYADNNANDSRVTDPSKVYGWQNQFNIDAINAMPVAADLKKALIYRYQQQDFIKHSFIIQIGYSLAI
jgi:hypothetical protein